LSEIRGIAQELIREFDSASGFTILLSASMLPYLEEPINRARFFDYNKQLEVYFDSKDLNRFSRVKELTEIIANRIKAPEIKGFERLLKLFREKGLMLREKEGPSEGMAWKGFGGVHSHYSLTPIGNAILIFQTSLRCSAADLRTLQSFDNWDDVIETEMNEIIESVVTKKLRMRDVESHFYAKRPDASYISQRIFEFIAGAPKSITLEQIREFIWDKAGEIHIGEIPEAIERLGPLLMKTRDTFALNERGKIARIGYANVLVEAALSIEDTELVHYMVAAKTLEEGAKEIVKQFGLWF